MKTFPKRALLSVSDKAGLVPLSRALRTRGCELYASGGTKSVLEAEGIEVFSVEKLSRAPEAFQGRMKTLSFPIFSGILARRDNASDDADREKLGIMHIDLVVVNFYPFEKSVGNATALTGELTELIDIGGPALVRAAAKNEAHVLVLSDPKLYTRAISELESEQGFSPALRRAAADQAWKDVAHYDNVIAAVSSGAATKCEKKPLRYGENPHQTAEFFIQTGTHLSPIAWNVPVTDAALSYNNILDFSAGFRLLSDLANWKKEAAHAVIIKHQNPCGVASDLFGRIDTALEMAWACDPVSAFGGMILLSKPLDSAAAKFLETRFIEGIAAPDLSRESPPLSILTAKRKNLKAVSILDVTFQEVTCEVTVPGGKLIQAADAFALEAFEVKTGETWSPAQAELAQFGVFAAKSLKSNAIAIVEAPSEGQYRMIGTGQGQPNRIEALAKLAIPRARAVLKNEAKEKNLSESILISDAFFPFADGIEAAAEAGIRFIVEPGGSLRDDEVIARAKELGVSLAFSHRRHFRH